MAASKKDNVAAPPYLKPNQGGGFSIQKAAMAKLKSQSPSAKAQPEKIPLRDRKLINMQKGETSPKMIPNKDVSQKSRGIKKK